MVRIIDKGFKFKPLTYDNYPSCIILHHAEAFHCTVEDIHSWHLNQGWSGIGYNYFIAKDGKIYRGRPENSCGAHALKWNTKSIGICVEGNYMVEQMPEVQKQAVINLCLDIKNRLKITEIYGHNEVNNTLCPGENYPLNEIKNIIKVEGVFSKMNTLEVQKWLNKNGFTDMNGNSLDEDGKEGQCTRSAIAKAKSVLQYILK